jgi:dTDP-4-dehydrorhamnose 3,5-epimerase
MCLRVGTNDEVEAEIQGVRLVPLTPITDERGFLVETYRRVWVPEGREAVQANLSVSHAGVLRGLHWHRRQADYWCVLSGVAHVALVDLRGSPSAPPATFERRIDTDDVRFGLAIPPGVAHGFYAETDVMLQYLVDEPYSGDDEFGLAWNDPALGLRWPVSDPMVSERDRTNPSLREAQELFAAGGDGPA